MYTLDNTVNDILKDKFVKKHFNYMMPFMFLGLVPKELRDEKLSVLPQKLTMPWGVPYISQGIVDVANQLHELNDNDNYEFVQLWAENTPEDFFPAKNLKDDVSLLLFKDSFKDNRPVAIISPGGAYVSVAIASEGITTAKTLADLGYAVAVLFYRTSPNHYPAPMLDLSLAIKYIRLHADELKINANDLMTVGFSAGSHLTAIQACYPEKYEKLLMDDLGENIPELAPSYKDISVKPDKVCLSYPVLSFAGKTAYDVYQNFVGDDDSLMDEISLELNATSEYPKAYMWACQDDEYHVADHINLVIPVFEKENVDFKYHIYPSGGHGIATGIGTSAEGWVDEMIEFMKS